jgi:hypothetical protein
LHTIRKLPSSPILPVVRKLPRSPSPPIRRLPPSPIQIPKLLTVRQPSPRAASAGSRDSRSYTPMSADEPSSTISGTTLARALIGNSFILSSDSRSSKYRSGLSRQDSATLGDLSFSNSPYWRDRSSRRRHSSDIVVTPESGRGSLVPPIPAVPFGVELSSVGGPRSARSIRSESRLRTSFDPESEPAQRASLSPATTPNDDSQSITVSGNNTQGLRRISPILEASPSASPNASNLLTLKDSASSICSSPAPSQLRASSLRGSEGESPSTSASSETKHLSDRHQTQPRVVDASLPTSAPASAASGQTIENLLNDYAGSPMDKTNTTRSSASTPSGSPSANSSFKNTRNRDSKQGIRGKVPIGNFTRGKHSFDVPERAV